MFSIAKALTSGSSSSSKINPWFVTGLIDLEWYFNIVITRTKFVYLLFMLVFLAFNLILSVSVCEGSDELPVVIGV